MKVQNRPSPREYVARKSRGLGAVRTRRQFRRESMATPPASEGSVQ